MTASSYAIYSLIACGFAFMAVGWHVWRKSSFDDGSFLYEILLWIFGAALLMAALLWVLIKSI